MKFRQLLLVLLATTCVVSGARSELQDQGLSSVMDIIDKAIAELNRQTEERGEELEPAELEEALQNAADTVINLSRTLGTLSYSRLQCGQADVLSEFTQRVQMMPDESRDPMRDAFQEGFDKSKEETPLLSDDECQRLTKSRARSGTTEEANVVQEKKPEVEEEEVEEVVEELPPEDPKFRHLRVAELSGQLAYKRRFCTDEQAFNRDYNEYLETIPEHYREEVKAAYWKGYKHGKRLNKNLTRDNC